MRWVADPFAPRAPVEPRAAEPGDFEREQIVAGSDPGAAHRDHGGGRTPTQARASGTAELRGRLSELGGAPVAEDARIVSLQAAAPKIGLAMPTLEDTSQ